MRHCGIAGAFCAPEQVAQMFGAHDFVPDGYARDGLAQLIILKKAAASRGNLRINFEEFLGKAVFS